MKKGRGAPGVKKPDTRAPVPGNDGFVYVLPFDPGVSGAEASVRFSDACSGRLRDFRFGVGNGSSTTLTCHSSTSPACTLATYKIVRLPLSSAALNHRSRVRSSSLTKPSSFRQSRYVGETVPNAAARTSASSMPSRLIPSS